MWKVQKDAAGLVKLSGGKYPMYRNGNSQIHAVLEVHAGRFIFVLQCGWVLGCGQNESVNESTPSPSGHHDVSDIIVDPECASYLGNRLFMAASALLQTLFKPRLLVPAVRVPCMYLSSKD